MDKYNREEYGVRVVPSTPSMINGWFPSPPDRRDYNEWSKRKIKINGSEITIRNIAFELGVLKTNKIPPRHSLRPEFLNVRNQGALGSCTAFPAVAIVEYLARTVYGVELDLSERFVYKLTRWLAGLQGDSGAYIRAAMACMRLFGAPPEQYWKYSVSDFDVEPSTQVQTLARNNSALNYFRHDADPSQHPGCVALNVRKWIAAGVPAMGGFYVFPSYTDGGRRGDIPFPTPTESAYAGHAICLTGYDDEIEIENLRDGSKTTGAFEFRNSWGRNWGNGGYGWIPYQYILSGYMVDLWSMLTADIVDVEEFGL